MPSSSSRGIIVALRSSGDNRLKRTSWLMRGSNRLLAYKDQMERHKAEKPQMEQRVAAEVEKLNAERARRGQPPIVFAYNNVYGAAHELGLEWKTPIVNPPMRAILRSESHCQIL